MRHIAILLILAAAAAPAWAKDIDETFEKEFQVNSETTLRLEHGDGDLILIPWDRDIVDVRIVYRAKINKWGLGSYDRDFSVHYDVNDDVIHIRAEEIGGGIVIGAVSNEVEEFSFTVRAPAWVPVRTTGDDGDVEVAGWEGDLNLSLDDGDVIASKIRATLDIRCEDGDVRIDEYEGSLDVRSDDGDVQLNRASGDCSIEVEDGDIEINGLTGDLYAVTDDGDIRAYDIFADRLRLRSEDGDITCDPLGGRLSQAEIRAQDGRIALTLDPEASLEFLASTDDGYLDVDLHDISDLKTREDRVSGVLGSGTGSLRVHSESGRVRLR